MDYTLTNLAKSLADWQLEPIRCELKGIEAYEGPGAARWWWFSKYAQKFPDWEYREGKLVVSINQQVV